MWLRTFSHLCHVCYSLRFVRYFIIGFRCGVEVCFYNWKEKIINMGHEEGFYEECCILPLTIFQTIPSSPTHGQRIRASLQDLRHFSQVNLLYFCMILRRLHFPFSHGFHFGLIIFKQNVAVLNKTASEKIFNLARCFYLNIKLLWTR